MRTKHNNLVIWIHPANICCFIIISFQTLYTNMVKHISVQNIGAAPFTQTTHVRNKNSIIQGRAPNVLK